MSADPKNAEKIAAAAKRQERLDAALRENLKKRKQQARKRTVDSKKDPAPPERS